MAQFDRIAAAAVVVVVEDDVTYWLAGLCRACGACEAHVVALVSEGVLDPAGANPSTWVFAGTALRTVRTTRRLAVDLHLGSAAAAVVLDLMRQVDALQARLRRAGIDADEAGDRLFE